MERGEGEREKQKTYSRAVLRQPTSVSLLVAGNTVAGPS